MCLVESNSMPITHLTPFVIGPGKPLFHMQQSLAVAEAPAKAYNPLFIYGGLVLGNPFNGH